jgi:transcriptional regulator with XRE-family HTH domain
VIYNSLKYIHIKEDFMKENITLGDCLIRIRTSMLLSQQELCDELGLRQPAMSNWELDKRLPTMQSVRKIYEKAVQAGCNPDKKQLVDAYCRSLKAYHAERAAAKGNG